MKILLFRGVFMAARSGVVDTSVFKGIADLHAEVLSNDPVVAPAHEVVQDSDLIADPSIHADAAPDHGSDTAATSTGDASADDTGPVHADLAYADTDHAYADADHGVADADHAYADHAYADSIVPDSTVAFVDHTIPLADDGMPHSLGAAQGQGDSHDAAAWWWVGGAALAAGGLGYWAGHEHNDDSSSSSSTAAPDVHVVVESEGAFIDANGDGVQQDTETTVADFGHNGNADLASEHVTIHFNDVPWTAIDITGFGADDKIEFHVEAMVANNGLNALASYLTDLAINTSGDVGTWAAFYPHATVNAQASIDIHQIDTYTPSFTSDLSGNALGSVYYMDIGYKVFTGTGASPALVSSNEAGFAFWTDAGNALNDNALVFPTWNGADNTATVVADFNANNEGSVVDFIWPVVTV
jgi:hypothetical protein